MVAGFDIVLKLPFRVVKYQKNLSGKTHFELLGRFWNFGTFNELFKTAEINLKILTGILNEF